jgi:hypothetical protein
MTDVDADFLEKPWVVHGSGGVYDPMIRAG